MTLTILLLFGLFWFVTMAIINAAKDRGGLAAYCGAAAIGFALLLGWHTW